MSYLQKFTEEEQELLMSAPQMVGGAVAAIGSSGLIGSMKEAMASVRALMDGSQDYPNNELIKALSPNVKDAAAAKVLAKEQKEVFMERLKASGVKGPTELAELMIDDLCRINDILVEKEETESANEVRAWLSGIGAKVAEAAKEGSFLGFGGVKVSDEEWGLLDRINNTLNVPEV